MDLGKPSIARVYDYVLGGKEHFEIDRRVAEAMYQVVPATSQLAKDNRNHLRRAVRYLVGEAGIQQIIDIGSGLPTSGNVHEIAHKVDPGVRVVYVDNDPIVLAHGRALLSNASTTTVITADVRDPGSIFENRAPRELIDLGEPYAVLAASILHHISDDEDPYAVTAETKDRLGVECHLLISNFLDDDEQRAKDLERAFLKGGLGTGRFRTWAGQRCFFEGLEMVEPGLVYAMIGDRTSSRPTTARCTPSTPVESVAGPEADGSGQDAASSCSPDSSAMSWIRTGRRRRRCRRAAACLSLRLYGYGQCCVLPGSSGFPRTFLQ